MNLKSGVIRELVLWLSAASLGFLLVFYFDQLSGKIDQFMQLTRNLDTEYHVREPEVKKETWENIIVIHANREGHFATRAKINEEDALIMVDTGATLVALSYETAEDIGLNISQGDFSSVARTANGITKVAHVELDEIRIGDIVINDLKAVVAEPGKLEVNLLGMNFLSKLKRFEFSGRKLVLVQ